MLLVTNHHRYFPRWTNVVTEPAILVFIMSVGCTSAKTIRELFEEDDLLFADFSGGQTVKNPPAMQETWISSLGQAAPQEKGMATYSSIPAWRIPWSKEPGRLQPVGSQRVRQDWAANTLTHRKCTRNLKGTQKGAGTERKHRLGALRLLESKNAVFRVLWVHFLLTNLKQKSGNYVLGR